MPLPVTMLVVVWTGAAGGKLGSGLSASEETS